MRHEVHNPTRRVVLQPFPEKNTSLLLETEGVFRAPSGLLSQLTLTSFATAEPSEASAIIRVVPLVTCFSSLKILSIGGRYVCEVVVEFLVTVAALSGRFIAQRASVNTMVDRHNGLLITMA